MTSQTSRPQAGIAAVLAASVLWGTTGTAATFASGVSPLAIGAVAMGVAEYYRLCWPCQKCSPVAGRLQLTG